MGRPSSGYRNAAGDKVPGVTTVLGLLNKPALPLWAYKQGRKHERLAAQGKPAPTRLYESVEKAAQIGTLAHECCEAIIHDQPMPALPDDCRDRVERAVQNFRDWQAQAAVRFHAVEVSLVSERYQFGGTLDFVAEIGGKLVMGDLKTSSAVYPEMIVQLAAYQLLWHECRPDEQLADDAYLLRIDKESGDFAWHKYGDLSNERAAFLALLEVYGRMNLVKKRAG